MSHLYEKLLNVSLSTWLPFLFIRKAFVENLTQRKDMQWRLLLGEEIQLSRKTCQLLPIKLECPLVPNCQLLLVKPQRV